MDKNNPINPLELALDLNSRNKVQSIENKIEKYRNEAKILNLTLDQYLLILILNKQ